MNKKLLYFIIVIGVVLVLPVVFIFYYVGPLRTIVELATNKAISGKIYDCTTNEPIQNAQITIAGTGLGFRDKLFVWDKAYFKTDKSDSQGLFRINYSIGTEVTVNKDGYLQAYYYTSPSKNVDIGLLSNINVQDKNERTYQCKLESECYREVVKDGATVGWDSCANPSYKP